MSEDIDQYPDRVANLIQGKTIFVTGGTGFLGKVFVEKLLRCMDPKRIYLLIRDKKGKDPKQRLKEIFQNPLFDSVRKLKGEQIFEKCHPIPGDAAEIELGISEEDRKILQDEVELVYHSAATVRFDEALKRAVLLNVRGTLLMLQLATGMKKLQLFIHVSTAYCHLQEKVLYEKAYPACTDPYQVIKTVEWMKLELVEAITKTLLGNMPNTYAFTKNLGEALCVEYMAKIPLIVTRPSVVVPIWKEPIPGWTDNINGPTGLLIGAGKGVLRTMYCNQEGYADFIPVDVVANALLVCTFDAIDNKLERQFYNFCSSAEYKISYDELIKLGRRVVYERIPLNGVAWYPGGSMKKSRLLHNICVVLFHYLPAVIVDALLVCLGYKPVLWRVQRRIDKGFEVFEYYANHQWDFNNDLGLEARRLMNPKERSLYKVDGDGVDYLEYFTDCTHAARLYVLKESDDTIPAARRHMRVMYWVDLITKILFVCLMFYLVYKYFLTPVFNAIF